MPEATIQSLESELKKAKDPKERARLLNELSFRIYRRDPRRAVEHAKEAGKLAEQLNDSSALALSLLRAGYAERELAEFKPALEDLEKACTIFRTLKDAQRESACYMVQAGIYEDLGNFPQAIEHFSKARDIRAKLGLITHHANALTGLGSVALKMGEFVKALDYFLEALKLQEQSTDQLAKSSVLCNIGSVYLEVRDITRAEKYIQQSLDLKQQLGDTMGQATTTEMLGQVRHYRNDLAGALALYQEALALATSVGRKDIEVIILEKLSRIYLEQGELEQAEHNFNKAISLSKEYDLNAHLADCYLGLGESYIAAGRGKDALNVLVEGLALADANKQAAVRTMIYRELARANKLVGDLSESIRYYDLHLAESQNVFSSEMQRLVADRQARHEIERAEEEREKMRLRAEELMEESERRAKELTTVALHLVQKNEFLDELREEIRDTLAETAPAKKLINRINDHIHMDRDWETFEAQFQQVHGDFLKKLSIQFPSLTPTEIKICALMKLNLTSKAIANLFSLSLRTVENHRLSIRKKMGLSADANLVSYLTSL